MKHYYCCWIQFSRVHRRTCCYPKTLIETWISPHHTVNPMRLTNGTSLILKTTTPWCSGVSSVIRPRCALTTWLPYKKGISPLGLIHTYAQRQLIKITTNIVKAAYFIFGILCNVIKCCYVQLEFTTLAEFSKACPEADEVRTSHRDPKAH